MTWALWLAVPVLATVLAAVWSWLRSRPGATPNTGQSMQAHSDYLDALVQTARDRNCAPSAEPNKASAIDAGDEVSAEPVTDPRHSTGS